MTGYRLWHSAPHIGVSLHHNWSKETVALRYSTVMKNPQVHSVFKVDSCITICFTTKSWQNKSKTTLCTCLHGKLLASAEHLKVCFKSLMLFVTFSNSLLSSRWQKIQVCLPPGRSLFTGKSKTLDKRQPRELVDLLAACLTSVQVLLPDKTRN